MDHLRMRLPHATWFAAYRPKPPDAPFAFRADMRIGEHDFVSIWHLGGFFVARTIFASFRPLDASKSPSTPPADTTPEPPTLKGTGL